MIITEFTKNKSMRVILGKTLSPRFISYKILVSLKTGKCTKTKTAEGKQQTIVTTKTCEHNIFFS